MKILKFSDDAVSSYEEEQIDDSIDLQNVLDRLEDIVLTPQEDY